MNHRLLFTLLLFSCSFKSYSLPDDQFKPVKIKADSAVRNEKDDSMIYKGNVLIQQGSLRVNAESVRVDQASQKSAILVATGNPAQFRQQPATDKEDIVAEAKSIRYSLTDGTVLLQGNAKLIQSESKVSSNRIVYYVDRQIFEASKDENDHSPERVEVVIPAPKKEDTKENTDSELESL